MLAHTPVLAADSGGPVETIREGETGWLRSPDDVPAWTDVMQRTLAISDAKLFEMGNLGAKRVRDLFGRDQMAERIDDLVSEIVAQKRPVPVFNTIVSAAGFALFFTLGLVVTSMMARK
jgi:alpha-1,3/alpha-1,6-mannosyltransferase